MPALPYQTFPSTNRVFVGADAFITTLPAASTNYPHWVVIKDRNQQPVVELCLTFEAAVDLRDLLTNILVAHAKTEATKAATPEPRLYSADLDADASIRSTDVSPPAQPADAEPFTRTEAMVPDAWDAVAAVRIAAGPLWALDED